ncbi:carbamoyltransferase HypF [Aldersonia kunmingensis]|uniref:carbamoyltransferase HypF n=1 Tax=Aldersonia kunmingensis TaxID=408066 RepID=UPI000836BB98|nr:carbamoyltransferase HypF [Aldersonia kunmingensis]
MTATALDGRVERVRLVVRGIVQGVGYRPFVARLANELGLSGHCGNDESSVFIEVEGSERSIAQFVRRLRSDSPPMSEILDVSSVRLDPRGDTEFHITASRHRCGARTLIPPDVATCADCLREFHDPANRRYLHPFINCTNCGPRFTVIRDLPYDRPATTMADFEMCSRCAAEYSDPTDRRYHAQPISCHECGPRVHLEQDGSVVTGDQAVFEGARRALLDGKILAVKGIGGYHLVCNATDPAAVATLRERKHRPAKPFAVMAADLDFAYALCVIDDVEQGLLQQPARPIVLLRKRSASQVADEVAPGLDELGVMLPYTPVHQLLFDATMPRVLVMTSGNLSGEPLCFADDDARMRLAGIADVFLVHDREIAVPCEDSVVTVSLGSEVPIRRSRGFAPLPVPLPDTGPVVLGVGAELKNTFCLTREDLAFCSAHLGDMGTLESQRAFERSIDQLTTLHGVTPSVVVADDHPGYSTRRWAERYCDVNDLALHTVQHHHAHVASLIAEHGRLGTPLLGIAFDGTGYGCDRTVWGGELVAVGTEVLDFERVGHLQSFQLPGGDTAIRNPVRVAMSLLHEAGIEASDALPCIRALRDGEHELIASQLSTGAGCVRTTSAGRLFDGVSSLLGVRHRVTYEAQAAIELEALARSAARPIPLAIDIDVDQLTLRALLEELVPALRRGDDTASLALGFHHALAHGTAELAVRRAKDFGIRGIGLTGGVFQNRLLLQLLREELEYKGFDVLTHRRVPANDGGLSLGQAVLGRAIAARHARMGAQS